MTSLPERGGCKWFCDNTFTFFSRLVDWISPFSPPSSPSHFSKHLPPNDDDDEDQVDKIGGNGSSKMTTRRATHAGSWYSSESRSILSQILHLSPLAEVVYILVNNALVSIVSTYWFLTSLPHSYDIGVGTDKNEAKYS